MKLSFQNHKKHLFRNIWAKRLPFHFFMLGVAGVMTWSLLTKEDPLPIQILIGVLALFFGIGGCLMVAQDIKMIITGQRPVVATDEGLYLPKKFIEWSRIEGFKMGRDMSGYDEIGIVTNDADEEIAAKRFALTRWLLRIEYKKNGYIHGISSDDYSGKPQEFKDELDAALKRYQDRIERNKSYYG